MACEGSFITVPKPVFQTLEMSLNDLTEKLPAKINFTYDNDVVRAINFADKADAEADPNELVISKLLCTFPGIQLTVAVLHSLD